MLGSGGAATERLAGKCSPVTASPAGGPRGATPEPCVDCSRPGREVTHYLDSVCPFRRRERDVQCKGASLAESRDGTHRTWNDDAVCDACKAKNAAVVAQLKAQQS